MKENAKKKKPMEANQSNQKKKKKQKNKRKMHKKQPYKIHFSTIISILLFIHEKNKYYLFWNFENRCKRLPPPHPCFLEILPEGG